jgi:C1A family cysteine protease
MTHKYGYIPSKPDTRDYKYVRAVPIEALPPVVDLTSKLSPIRDQKDLGSCSWEAMVAFLEFNQKPLITKSVLFGYYNTRLGEGAPNEDTGCEPRDVFKSAQKDGDCANKYWPYWTCRFNKKPSTKAYTNAIYHITSYHALTNLHDIKACLASGSPVYIGFTVYSSFESEEVAKNGIMPMPVDGEEILGGHAVVIVGYDDNKQRLLVRNSWGKKWGVKGYFYMPYGYINHPGYVTDIWAIVV